MIIVKLWGGMCNQMFQYAFGYALAKKHGDELRFDVEFYKHQPKHVGSRKRMGTEQFALTRMTETERPFPATILENKYVSHVLRYHTGCMLRMPHINFMMEKLHKYYDEVPYAAGKVNYYDGYWPTDRYFVEIEDDIRREFTPSETILDKVAQWRQGIDSDCTVAVHVRRGDYLNKINQAGVENVIGGRNFYDKAIDYCKEHLSRPLFCFMSDDIAWCREAFGDMGNAVFVENTGSGAALADLFSIAACNHGIMSPSTFSWWGNWLRRDREKSLVVMPDMKAIIPHFALDNWVQL